MKRVSLLLIALLLGLPAAGSSQGSPVTVRGGTDRTKQVVRGTLVTPDTVFAGEVVIEGDSIACVAVDCADPPGAWVFTVWRGYIYPGFIDSHNHVAYNVLPKWTPPRLYTSRRQWQGAVSYKRFKAPYNELKDQYGLYCEMVKWGEAKALVSGITSIQGTSPGSACIRTLVRNVENQNELGTSASHVRTFILDISNFPGPVNWDATKALVVHVAEGLPSDERSRAEFDILKQKGLLRSETAIIHGTALGDAEFEEMGRAGTRLIWSPQSNRALYGATTNIRSALSHGVEVSIGVDWNPSGSDDIFGELRAAAEFNEEQFAGAIQPADWIRMITVNPARALALDSFIGRLAPGMKADITVLRSRAADPHTSLLASHPQDVELVWVGGELLYGREQVVRRLRPECEPLEVNGARKRICVQDSSNPVAKSSQSLAEIRAILAERFAQLSPLVR